MNQVVLVGRLTKNPEIITTKENTQKTQITIAVSRNFKNVDGIYETDLIDITLWNGIAENTANYCNKGDIIGVRGRIQTKIEDDIKITEIVADRITFLQSSKQKEQIKEKENEE